jgi:hypothetical protein
MEFSDSIPEKKEKKRSKFLISKKTQSNFKRWEVQKSRISKFSNSNTY